MPNRPSVPPRCALALDHGDAAIEPLGQQAVLRRPDDRPEAPGAAADDDRRQHGGRFLRYANTSWNTRATRSTTCSSTECDVGRFTPVAESSMLLGQERAYLP